MQRTLKQNTKLRDAVGQT